MCCPSGVCGPEPDATLIEMKRTLAEVTRLGAQVERYAITQQPEKFKENAAVIRLIQEQQLRALPITAFNGTIVKVGSYPSLEEFKEVIRKS